jgi:hypothetical protein
MMYPTPFDNARDLLTEAIKANEMAAENCVTRSEELSADALKYKKQAVVYWEANKRLQASLEALKEEVA